MKKIILLIFIFIFVFTQISAEDPPLPDETKPPAAKVQKADTKDAPQASKSPEVVIKTYFLKYISPREIQRALRYHFWRMSGLDSKKMITVKFFVKEHNIKEFERLLKKLDVPKRTIHFRIFTIIASQQENGGRIENRDLRKVLNELKKFLSFQHFKVDGVSLLTLKEGAHRGRIQLSSSIPNLFLTLEDVSIQESMGKNLVDIGELDLKFVKRTLISSETSIKENGYLVAGVSRMGPSTGPTRIGQNEDALVLVINAQIE